MTTADAEHVEATVRALYAAFLEGDRARADALIADGFTFTSPYDDRIDRAAYFERCFPHGDRFKVFEIERVAVVRDDAFVSYRAALVDATTFSNADFVEVRGGRIQSAQVYFGASYRKGRFVPLPGT
ncbi:hypothetical protein WPS_12750 [Vulcanimicrobium alpinum]|uniref:DUF4440 domain-containing protein n=1 Tax=Vulcanimicrobium alpinum TaxID=3016050 RepID=A0AAN2C969_UNVUL|nr:hypothetical protein WPS_12750 [Vulcanimicrobium alpinum]